jgi:hypothetical protein
MNDGVMNTWSVVESNADSSDTVHICARQETAEYLRDWCEAIEYNSMINTVATLGLTTNSHLNRNYRQTFIDRLAHYHVEESEVIL